MPQVGSRKRAAPGAPPAIKSSDSPTSDFKPQAPYPSAEQFLQWNLNNNSAALGARPDLPDPLADPSTYAGLAPQAMRSDQQNQLARRAGTNQMISRGSYNGTNGDGWNGQPGAMQQQPQPGQTTWQPDDDSQLDHKAAEAKTKAQASRKTIPPFVQKLSR